MDIISKLNTLKSIEPEENWVVETRKKVLSEAPVLDWKVTITEVKSKQENGIVNRFFSKKQASRDGDLSRLNLKEGNTINRVRTTLFSKRLAVSAFALVFMVSGGAFTVEASKSSLPGDPLYMVKIATEDVTLAVTSKNKKAEVEMWQVNKRLEEFDKISKNHSDPKQGEKIKMLLGEIEVKTNNSKEHLTKIEDNGVKAKIAKVINVQTEKCAEVLVKTGENLPDVVKDKVSEKLASVVESNEKVNFESLAIRVKLMTDEDKEEIATKVKEKVEKRTIEDEEDEGDVKDVEGDMEMERDFDTDQDAVEAKKSMEEGVDNEDSTENNTEESEETEVTMEDTKKELLGILDGLNISDNNEGDVKGDSCVCEVDVECNCADTGDEGEELGGSDAEDGDVSDEVESEDLKEDDLK